MTKVNENLANRNKLKWVWGSYLEFLDFHTHFLRTKKMLGDEWRRSVLVLVYYNNGDTQSGTNYREIKL